MSESRQFSVARVRDLWFDKNRNKTTRHPDRGGNPTAKRWLAIWEGSNGREDTKAFARQVDATRYATAMEADALRGIRYADPRRGAITVREFAEKNYLPSQLHLRVNSADTYASHLRTHIYPALGDRRIGTITRSDVQSFVTAVSAKLAPTTTETVYAVLRALMQAALDHDPQIIFASPCTKIRLPKIERTTIEPLAATAIVALHDAITPRYRVMVILGAGLGLREGEAFGLTAPRVDFLRRRIQVIEQAQRGQLAPLKAPASRRTLPADDWVLNGISAHLQRYGRGPNDVIVTNAIGRIVKRSSFGACWRQAVKRAGLPAGTRFHDLRHFYASALIAANLNPKVIQVRLGHASITETMDTYGHLFPDAEDLGRGTIDLALGAVLTEQEQNWEVPRA
jgi:integrase